MLGSVANHAWAEDSLYLKIGKGGHIYVEQESKYAPVRGFKIGRLRNKKWTPLVYQEAEEELDDESVLDSGTVNSNGRGSNGTSDIYGSEIEHAKPPRSQSRSRRSSRAGTKSTPKSPARPKIEVALANLGPGWHSTNVIAERAGIKPGTAWKQLDRNAQVEQAETKGKWRLRNGSEH